MRCDPDVAGVEETRCGREVHIPKPMPRASVISFRRFHDRQKHDLMATFQKFKGKIDIMEKRTAKIGHFPTEEEDFHYVY